MKSVASIVRALEARQIILPASMVLSQGSVYCFLKCSRGAGAGKTQEGGLGIDSSFRNSVMVYGDDKEIESQKLQVGKERQDAK